MCKQQVNVFFSRIFFVILLLPISLLYAETPIAWQKTLLLAVTVNHTEMSNIATCYLDRENNLWINKKDLIQWKLPLPQTAPIMYRNEPYYSLKEYPDLKADVNQRNLTLQVTAPAHFFPTTIIENVTYNPQKIRPQHLGGFFNYDLASIRSPVNPLTNSALTEIGVFNHWGVGTNDFLFSNFTNANNSTNNYHVTRLNTLWTLDEPEKIATWRFGDSITGASTWSGAARFGGVQYATNFNTQPNFITFPLPGIRGEAIVPSNIDIFVNGILNQRQILNNGSYIITDVPVITGAGTVNVVTQDLLGRTQVVNLPYYASPTLLKTGLTNFSYEAGFIRNNYGINSNDYGNLFITATYQKGINDNLTLGIHSEILTSEQTVGIASDYLFKKFAVISLATAVSRSDFGKGWLASAGFIRQTPRYSFGAKSTYTSPNYQQIGIQVGEFGPLGELTTNQVFAGYSTEKLGSLGLSYTTTKLFFNEEWTHHQETQQTELLTISYSHSIFNNASIIFSGVIDFHNSPNNQYYLSLILPLDTVHTLSTYVNSQNHRTQPAVLYTKNLPLGDGYGYHLLATTNGDNGPGGDFTYQNDIGTYSARAYRFFNGNSFELDANGAIIALDNHLFLSRRMTESFALVQVPGYEDIGVYYQNQLIGRTNRDGNLLVPQILPYQENILEIEIKDLPINTTVPYTTQQVMPYYRSGSIAHFNIKQNRNVILHVILANGENVPVGATAKIGPINYPVGYDGALFITDATLEMIHGVISYGDLQCNFSTVIPVTKKVLTKIDNVICL